MSFFRPARALLAAGLSAALGGTMLAAGGPSDAAAPPASHTVAKGLVSPLSVSVDDRGNVWFTQNFAGQLWVKKPGEAPRKVYSSAVGPDGPAEVGGVSTRDKIVYFVSGSRILRRKSHSDVRVVANIGKYEATHNPDQNVRYGAVGLSKECQAQWPAEGPPLSYKGIVESHPYATAYGGGALYVADAGANAVFRVKDGKVRTVAVLPPTTVTITSELAESAGMPDCAVGKKYRFEGVPTDVEYHKGKLYVSSLPGGPEDGTAPGAVYKINASTGNRVRLATGLVSASGVAVAGDGNIYVSELFANRITRIAPSGAKRTFVSTPMPAAVEVRGSRLFTTENVLSGLGPDETPAGKVVRYRR